MTRSQGIQMVKRYSHIEPEDKQLFLDWVEMDEKVFDRYIYERRDPKIWRKSSEGTWELKDSVINYEENNDINSVSLEVEQDCHFKVTPKGENGEDNEYLLMGRCYLDKYNYGAIQDQPQGGLTPRAWKKKEI